MEAAREEGERRDGAAVAELFLGRRGVEGREEGEAEG
jgi:hypothetical protein